MGAFPHNELEERLLAASRSELELDDWLQHLARAVVHVPLAPGGSEGGSVPVLSIDGGSYVPVFTSEEELRAAAPDASAISPVSSITSSCSRGLRVGASSSRTASPMTKSPTSTPVSTRYSVSRPRCMRASGFTG